MTVNTNTRIQLSDSLMDVFFKMSDGNPGTIACLAEMEAKTDWYANVPGFTMILNLDSMGIYGEKIYMLWNDCCDKDLTKMELVLRNWQMGQLPLEDIHENLSQGRGTEFKNLKTLDELFKTSSDMLDKYFEGRD